MLNVMKLQHYPLTPLLGNVCTWLLALDLTLRMWFAIWLALCSIIDRNISKPPNIFFTTYKAHDQKASSMVIFQNLLQLLIALLMWTGLRLKPENQFLVMSSFAVVAPSLGPPSNRALSPFPLVRLNTSPVLSV